MTGTPLACACRSNDRFECKRVRYDRIGHRVRDDDACECSCHNEFDGDEAEQ